MTPPPAALVRPGTVHVYEWTVPIGAGPTQGDADCLTYLYYSGVDPVKDTSSGLVGPLLVCRLGSLKKGVQVRSQPCVWTLHFLLSWWLFAGYVVPNLKGFWFVN